MNKLMAIMFILTTTACATAARYTPDERCALQGMKVGAVSSGEEISTNYNFSSGASSRGRADYSSVTCVPLVSDEDKCHQANLARSAQPKVEYNSSLGSKRVITGLGYCAFILPGLAAKIIYDDQAGKAESSSHEIYRGLANSCSIK